MVKAWEDEKGNLMSVPRWFMDELARHMEDPVLTHMLRENARTIRAQIELHDKRRRVRQHGDFLSGR